MPWPARMSVISMLPSVVIAAWWIELLPLVWLSALAMRGHRRDVAFWWIAIAFAVSFASDTAAIVFKTGGWAISCAYPMAQVALIVAVLANAWSEAAKIITALCASALFAVGLEDMTKPEWAFHLIAFGTVTVMAWRRPALGRLRLALLVYFGLSAALWCVHVAWLTTATWYPYKIADTVGLLLFCWATVNDRPALTLTIPHAAVG